ncbi:MAG: amphi-Trp domain-containing protein [Candidatus Nanohaloarchaea archaeon]
MEKEFILEKEELAELLRDIAESVEEGQVNLDGDDWKVAQPVSGNVPVRVFSDEEELEIGFKLSD